MHQYRHCGAQGQNRDRGEAFQQYQDRADDGFGEYKLKMDLPNFSGKMHREEMLDWMAEVERYFDYNGIPEAKKVKIVALRLKRGLQHGGNKLSCIQKKPV